MQPTHEHGSASPLLNPFSVVEEASAFIVEHDRGATDALPHVVDYILDQYRDNLTWPMTVNPMDAYYFGINLFDYPSDDSTKEEGMIMYKWDLVIACRHSLPVQELTPCHLVASTFHSNIIENPFESLLLEDAYWVYGISISLRDTRHRFILHSSRQGWFPTNYIAWLPRASIVIPERGEKIGDVVVCISMLKGLFLHPMTGSIVQLSTRQYTWIDDDFIFSNAERHAPVWEVVEQHPNIWPWIHSSDSDSKSEREWCVQPISLQISPAMQVRIKSRKWLDTLHELLGSECRYVNRLNMMCHVFQKTLARMLSKPDYELIFGLIPVLRNSHEEFLHRLSGTRSLDLVCLLQNVDILFVLEEFISDTNVMQSYTTYCMHQERSIERLCQLRSCDALLDEFLRVCIKQNDTSRGLDLSSHLLEPMQRITRYPLLLRQLQSCHANSSTDALLKKAEALVTGINQAALLEKTRQKTNYLTEMADPITRAYLTKSKILHADTVWLKDGILRKEKSNHPLHAFLFQDVILFLEHNDHKDEARPICIYQKKPVLWICDIDRIDEIERDDTAFEITCERTLNMRFLATSVTERELWISSVTKAMNRKAAPKCSMPEPAIDNRTTTVGTLTVSLLQMKLPIGAKGQLLIMYNGRHPSKIFSPGSLLSPSCEFKVCNIENDFLQLSIVTALGDDKKLIMRSHPSNIPINIVNSYIDRHTDILEYALLPISHDGREDMDAIRIALMLQFKSKT